MDGFCQYSGAGLQKIFPRRLNEPAFVFEANGGAGS
jgi:hypothetical protein